MMDQIQAFLVPFVAALMSVIAFFLKKVINKLDGLDQMPVINDRVQNLAESVSEFREITQYWTSIRSHVDELSTEFKLIRASMSDIAVLKAHQETMWKKFDEIQKEIHNRSDRYDRKD